MIDWDNAPNGATHCSRDLGWFYKYKRSNWLKNVLSFQNNHSALIKKGQSHSRLSAKGSLVLFVFYLIFFGM